MQRFFHQRAQVAFHIPAVVQAGQRIGHRSFDTLLQPVTQEIGITAAADLSAHTRQHFVTVDRTHQVIVDAKVESAQQARFGTGFNQHDDRCMPVLVEGADLRAQAQAIRTFEAEADHHQIELPGNQALQRHLRIGFQMGGMLLFKRLDHALPRTRMIIDNEQPAALGVGLMFLLHGLQKTHLFASVGAHPHFIGERFEARKIAHACDERNVIYGLSEEIVGTRLKALHSIRGLIKRRDHDHGDVLRARIRFQAPADFKAVHAGHHDVEQHDIGTLTCANLKGIGAIAGRQHFEILGAEPGFQELHIGEDIIHHQNARSHRQPSLTYPPTASIRLAR